MSAKRRAKAVLDAMKAARDRAVDRMYVLELEFAAERRNVDDWNERITRSERRNRSRA